MSENFSPSGGPGLKRFAVATADAGGRLDRFLAASAPDFSRAQLQALIKASRVRLNARTVIDPGHRVKCGDAIELDVPPPQPARPLPEPIPLAVVYEDDSLIVIDKPAGLVVHPAPGNFTGTLVNALLAHCGASLSGIGGVLRPGIVHRLDKDTSGLMVAAKTDAAHKSLSAQFADHGRTGLLERRYLALAWGKPPHKASIIRTHIARHASDRMKMAVTKGRGREAVTYYKIMETFGCSPELSCQKAEISLVSCTLETGRTHQVRVHLAHIGCPVIGDGVYGAGFQSKTRVLHLRLQTEIMALRRQALHAETLAFEHPKSGRVMRFSSPPPEDMTKIIGALRNRH